jgi:hypothetical protein
MCSDCSSARRKSNTFIAAAAGQMRTSASGSCILSRAVRARIIRARASSMKAPLCDGPSYKRVGPEQPGMDGPVCRAARRRGEFQVSSDRTGRLPRTAYHRRVGSPRGSRPAPDVCRFLAVRTIGLFAALRVAAGGNVASFRPASCPPCQLPPPRAAPPGGGPPPGARPINADRSAAGAPPPQFRRQPRHRRRQARCAPAIVGSAAASASAAVIA